MVSDAEEHNPFAVDPSSAAMDFNPVQSPATSHAGDDADVGDALHAPCPVAAPAAASLRIAAVPVAAVAAPASSSVLQTVDVRRHVPVVLDLTAGNYAQWRRHFDTVLGMFGLRDHVDAATLPRPADPDWVMADHAVIHWLYTTISPELLDAVMQPEDTALTVWTAVDDIFSANQLSRAVYVDAEYHAVVQGDMTVMQYCTKLKMYADQLRDLGQPVTETRQVFHLLRGLGRQYHAAIPHITSRTPLPTFLQVRSFLLLEEHRADQAARIQGAHALVAGRGTAAHPPVAPTPPSAPVVSDGSATRGRGRQRRRGRGNGQAGGQPAAPTPPRLPGLPAPAPGANSWTGLVQAWPMPWRAPGSGVLGPHPGTPPQQAMYAAPSPPLPGAYGYGSYSPPPGYGPLPYYPVPHAGAPPHAQPLDMASLQAALHSATAGPSSSGNSSDWYLDSGAASHMTNNTGHPDQNGDSPL